MNQGMPDVCLTPAAPSPIPVPYPNLAMHAMAVPFCPTIQPCRGVGTKTARRGAGACLAAASGA